MADAAQFFEQACRQQRIAYDLVVLPKQDTRHRRLLLPGRADLAIPGQPDLIGQPCRWRAAATIFAAGKLCLVVPDHRTCGLVPARIVIGGNASHEARLAMLGALPLLVGARSVRVMMVDACDDSFHGEEPGKDNRSVSEGPWHARDDRRNRIERLSHRLCSFERGSSCSGTALIVTCTCNDDSIEGHVLGSGTLDLIKASPLPLLITR